MGKITYEATTAPLMVPNYEWNCGYCKVRRPEKKHKEGCIYYEAPSPVS